MAEKIEYLMHEFDPSREMELQDEFNALGLEGWILTTTYGAKNVGRMIAIFYRKDQPKSPPVRMKDAP